MGAVPRVLATHWLLTLGSLQSVLAPSNTEELIRIYRSPELMAHVSEQKGIGSNMLIS